MKADRTEGEKRGRIELGEEEEVEGFDGDTGTNDEHKGVIVTKGNQIFIQKYILPFVYKLLFYREKEEEVTTRHRLRKLLLRVGSYSDIGNSHFVFW